MFPLAAERNKPSNSPKETAQKMAALGIETGADLKEKSIEFLTDHFGKSGPYFHGIARGIDNRQLRPDRERKSVGAEDTFAIDIADLEATKRELAPLVAKVWRYCEMRAVTRHDMVARNSRLSYPMPISPKRSLSPSYYASPSLTDGGIRRVLLSELRSVVVFRW